MAEPLSYLPVFNHLIHKYQNILKIPLTHVTILLFLPKIQSKILVRYTIPIPKVLYMVLYPHLHTIASMKNGERSTKPTV